MVSAAKQKGHLGLHRALLKLFFMCHPQSLKSWSRSHRSSVTAVKSFVCFCEAWRVKLKVLANASSRCTGDKTRCSLTTDALLWNSEAVSVIWKKHWHLKLGTETYFGCMSCHMSQLSKPIDSTVKVNFQYNIGTSSPKRHSHQPYCARPWPSNCKWNAISHFQVRPFVAVWASVSALANIVQLFLHIIAPD